MNNKSQRYGRPPSRILCALTVFYLAGVYLSVYVVLPAPAAILAAFILISAILRARKMQREIAGYILVAAMMAGNLSAGRQIELRDEPTPPNTVLSGVVSRIESEYRVYLEEVRLGDGGTTHRDVLLTLMAEDGAEKTIPAPKVGQRVSGTGRLFAQDEKRNPGGTDDRMRAICEGYELSGYLLPGWEVTGEERFSLTEVFRRGREALCAQIRRLFGEKASVFMAVMIGEKEVLDVEMTAAMRLTGTAHLLSVSGTHLSMLSAAIYSVLRFLPFRRRAATMVHAAVLFLFAGVTGFAVGTVRALIMTLMRMFAKERGEQYDRLTALAFAALVTTMHSPLMAFHAGFQFSYFVVLGLILLDRPLREIGAIKKMTARSERLAGMLTLCLCAQITAIPMQLMLYGYVPVLSLAMNLLCMMLMPVIMIGGWGCVLISLLHATVGRFCSAGLGLAAQLFEEISLYAAQMKGAIVRLPAPPAVSILLFAFAMMLISRKFQIGRYRKQALAVSLLLMAAIYLTRLNPAPRYVQLDVGQGDAALLRKGRRSVVVDVGPAYSYELLRYLRHEGLFVDAVFLSHLDEDHAGALEVLLSSEIDVDRVILDEKALDADVSDKVRDGLALLNEGGVAVCYAREGDFFDMEWMEAEVLSPSEQAKGSNERSLVLDAAFEERRLLLTGDLPRAQEPDVIAACDLLKVAHHGSASASSRAFLEQASPQIAVISVGVDNRYGHPHERVLDDLAAVGAQIVRTDQSGCVTIWLSDGMRVDTMLNAE